MKSTDSIIDWNSQFFPEHRRGITDFEWADMQPKGPPNFALGDVIEVKEGGFGIITSVSKPHDGFPSSYAIRPVEGYPPTEKFAWFYEGDIKRRIGKTVIQFD